MIELQKFKDLTYLTLNDCKIKKIEGLDTLVNLKSLILCNNQIPRIENI